MKLNLLILTLISVTFLDQIQNQPDPELFNRYISFFKQRYNIPKMETKRKIKISLIDGGFDSKIAVNRFMAKINIIGKNIGDFTEHGTHVGGIILGVNSEIELYSYNVMPNLNADTKENTIKAIHQSIKDQVDIINISMSGKTHSKKELKAFKEAEKAGIIIVVAAGNDGVKLTKKSCNIYPSCYSLSLKNMIVVGNLVEDNKIAESSNTGEVVDIYSLGTKIVSLAYKNDYHNLQIMSGTSQAAPFVTGYLSLLYSQREKNYTLKEVKDLISSKELASALKGQDLNNSFSSLIKSDSRLPASK